MVGYMKICIQQNGSKYTRPTSSFRIILSDMERLSEIFIDTKRRAFTLRQLSSGASIPP